MMFMKHYKPSWLAFCIMACGMSFALGMAVASAELILWVTEVCRG